MGPRMRIVGVVAFLLWLAAAVALYTSKPGHDRGLRVVSAVILGSPAAVAVVRGIRISTGRPTAHQKVKSALQAGLIKIHQDEGFPRNADISRISMHVWVLPTWYRRLALRFAGLVHDDGDEPPRFAPQLVRLSTYRFQDQRPSGVKFKLGVGLVGRCVARNKPNEILIMRYNTHPVKDALDTDDETVWRETDITINQNLPIKDAQKLAERYREVAAVAITEPTGQPIGCLTLELPKKIRLKLDSDTNKKLNQLKQKPLQLPDAAGELAEQHHPNLLVRHLFDTARSVQDRLQLREDGDNS